MAEQKNAAPQQRGKKKSDKKPAESGGSASRRKARKSLMYWNVGRKARNVRRNLAKQRKNAADANRLGRTEKGQARAMRRASVNLATGATSGLAAESAP